MELVYNITRFFYDALPELPTIVLIVLLWQAWDIKKKAEMPEGFWKTVFDDENGKRSALRVACLYAFAISSALFIYIGLNTKNPADSDGLLWFFGLYMAFWSGAPVASKALDIVAAKLK